MQIEPQAPPVFDLFVRLKPNTYPSGKFIHETAWSKATGKRCFTFNGNKWESEPVKQLISLMRYKDRLLKTNAFCLLMIRDRRKVAKPGEYVNPDEYTVYKLVNDILEVDECKNIINAMIKEAKAPKSLLK